jgi:predicted nucleotidyltransferase component of viral defense system
VIFSGGTALSKAYRLLQRFSEDTDFRVIAPEGKQGRKALSAFKHAFVVKLREDGIKIDDSQVQARDANRFFAIDIDYNTVFSQAPTGVPSIIPLLPGYPSRKNLSKCYPS